MRATCLAHLILLYGGYRRAVSSGLERPEHVAEHQPSYNAEIKNAWSYNSTPLYAFMAWRLIKENSIFYLPVLH
jgi:hypothetical protein